MNIVNGMFVFDCTSFNGGNWSAASDFQCRLVEDFFDVLVQISYSGLSAIPPDEVREGVVGDEDVVFGERSLGANGRNEIVFGDVEFFLPHISRQRDELHAITKRAGNGFISVGSADEEDLREVDRHIKIVISECLVLLGVQHLEQSSRRVTSPTSSNLVDFIDQDDGVGTFGSFEALNELAR